MKILLKNAKILTLKNEKIIDGEILVAGNKIAQIAQKINSKADRVIDCEGNLLMPGFKNAHTHSAMIFMRGFIKDAPLEIWLNKYVLPLEGRIQKGNVYHLTKLAYLEYLESGITSVFEMYYYPEEIVKASKDFGMRTLVLLSPYNTNLNKIKSINSKGLISLTLGFHSLYTSREKDLKFVSKLSKKIKSPIYTHCSETIKEVNDSKRKNNLTPVENLNRLKLLNQGGGIFHGVHLNGKDISILKKHNFYVCTCPSSNMKLHSGLAPIESLLKNKVMIAMGTDGASSKDPLDMTREMKIMSNKHSLKSFDILKMATVNGARFMNLNKCDVLAKGKLADIIMIDLHARNMKPSRCIINNLVCNATKDNVMMTMIDGKILYYKHKFYLKEDIKKIRRNANIVTNRLTRKK